MVVSTGGSGRRGSIYRSSGRRGSMVTEVPVDVVVFTG